eukprot:8476905-Pyramimonas_sp.AAC.1
MRRSCVCVGRYDGCHLVFRSNDGHFWGSLGARLGASPSCDPHPALPVCPSRRKLSAPIDVPPHRKGVTSASSRRQQQQS